jgi:ubiquinone/menaquinone biosynthesis C-methylase UbiE
MKTIYNLIGDRYTTHRKADQRIVDAVYCLLDLPDKAIIVDIGAGSGNYSTSIAEKGHLVYAIEPSIKMILQRNIHCNVKWIQATAEEIPIKEKAIDGIFIICALHHFQSVKKAAFECDRICKNGSIVVFTFDPRQSNKFWLADYFPSIWEQAFSVFDPIDKVAETIAGDKWKYDISSFPLPSDLTDRFMAFGWKHPELYLDETIRNSMSAFALADPFEVGIGIRKLSTDIESGIWDSKYGFIREKKYFDSGYRIIKLKRNCIQKPRRKKKTSALGTAA